MTLAPGIRTPEVTEVVPEVDTTQERERVSPPTATETSTQPGQFGSNHQGLANETRPGLTVVMPAYRQAKTIAEDLSRVIGVLASANLDFEIIVVVDGYLDETREIAVAIADNEPRVRVLGYQTNRGKGYAVRHGFESAQGDLVAFLDAGMDIDPKALIRAVVAQRTARADVVIGSKRHPMSMVSYPTIRRIYSGGYQLLTRVLFGFDVHDTQVGMKLFRREVIEAVVPRLLVKRFAFDVELLAVAYLLGYRRFVEVPVTIVHDGFASSVRLHSVFEMLWDTMAVWYRAKVRRHYTRNDLRNETVPASSASENSTSRAAYSVNGASR